MDEGTVLTGIGREVEHDSGSEDRHGGGGLVFEPRRHRRRHQNVQERGAATQWRPRRPGKRRRQSQPGRFEDVAGRAAENRANGFDRCTAFNSADSFPGGAASGCDDTATDFLATAFGNASDDVTKKLKDQVQLQQGNARNAFDQTQKNINGIGGAAIDDTKKKVDQAINGLQSGFNDAFNKLPPPLAPENTAIPPVDVAQNTIIGKKQPSESPPPIPPANNSFPPLPTGPETPKTITGGNPPTPQSTPPSVPPIAPKDSFPPLPGDLIPPIPGNTNNGNPPPLPGFPKDGFPKDGTPNGNGPTTPNFGPISPTLPPPVPDANKQPLLPAPQTTIPKTPDSPMPPALGNPPTGNNPPAAPPFGNSFGNPPASNPPMPPAFGNLPGPNAPPTTPNPTPPAFGNLPSPMPPASVPSIPTIPMNPAAQPPNNPFTPLPPLTPQVKIDTPKRYICKDGDTYDKISFVEYGSALYGTALEEYNRDNPGAAANVRRTPAILTAGTEILIPLSPNTLLERNVRPVPNTSSPAPFAPAARPLDVNISPPSPANKLPPAQTPGANQTSGVTTYRVPAAGMYLSHVAERQLGSPLRWIDIYRLNPGLQPEQPLREGMEIRVPVK
jgi:phage tail protein X